MKKIFTLLLVCCSLLGFSQSTTITISQVYGGGGNSGAPFNADYVELHNVSTVAQSLNGLSLQYASATAAGTWTGVFALPAASIPAGGFYLVRMSTTGATGSALPTPDAAPTTGNEIAMSATNGRIALVTGTTAISACPTANIVDLVGFGSSVCFEGTAATAVLSNSTAALRNGNGCTDTNNNGSDFTVGTPAPRNSATAASICGSSTPSPALTVGGTVTDFGSVTVLTNSPSQSFTITGANLTGFPGVITITAPSTDFEVSDNNTTFASSTTIPYTSATMAATTVYVRFTPQTAGAKTGNLSISGGGVSTAVTVAVSGNGTTTPPPATGVRISQVYGGGGNAGATYKQDFVEIYNPGTSAVDISGWSIQYASAAGPTTPGDWSVQAIPASTSIAAGKYYLIGLAIPTGAIGGDLPLAPDVVGTINMSGTAGKVALVNNSTALNGTTACSGATVVDVLGFSSSSTSATCAEGTAFLTTNIDATKSMFRKNNGCTDTNNNSVDFELGTVLPRNSTSAANNCSAPVPTLAVAGTINNFGNVVVLTNSASQNFTVSGTNLTGFPGVITITAPSTDFEVSTDNTTFSASVTVPYTTATLSSTTIYVRFTPQTTGVKSGNITISGGGTSTALTVAVSGTGVDPNAPAATVTALAAFGSLCLNTASAVNSFTINATNLTTANVTVGALAGYAYATAVGGPFTTTLSITQPGGTFTQQVFVQLTPTAVQSYNGNIAVSGGGLASPVNVAATGAGVNTTATVTTGAASAITITSATAAGTIGATGCSAVTSYGIEYSTTNNFPQGTGTKVVSTNLAAGAFTSALTGLTGATTYYYRAYATNDGGTAYGAQLSFITLAAPPAVITTTALTSFGSVCLPNSAGPNSFTITGANLTTANVTVSALAGYTYSTTETGTYTSTLSITQPGGAFSQVVYVKFTPAANQAYNGNIAVSGGGAAVSNVAASGTGTNTPPGITTAAATFVTTTSAQLNGSITSAGCNPVTANGFEYSGINNFVNGSGTSVNATTVTTADFSEVINDLVPKTVYYYKAFVQTSAGKTYGAQQSFKTDSIPTELIIYSTPVARGGNVHYSLGVIKPGHYATALYNSVGQKVFKKEMILQVGFINDNFTLPSTLPSGVYILQIENYEFKVRKQFIIK